MTNCQFKGELPLGKHKSKQTSSVTTSSSLLLLREPLKLTVRCYSVVWICPIRTYCPGAVHECAE
jgi:hypothetical protein